MSWREISNDELDKIIPVKPPRVNIVMNPIAHIIEISISILKLEMVAIHLKILIPVGMAMIIVAAVKYARVSMSIPTVNMWWAHTMNPKKPIADIA